MSKWTERIFEKPLEGKPTKPSKPGFVGFEGTVPGAFKESRVGDSPDSPAAAPIAEPTEAPSDDGPTAIIWRMWTPAPGGGFYELDAIRGRPYTRAEILAEFPDAVDLEPRNPPRPKPTENDQ